MQFQLAGNSSYSSGWPGTRRDLLAFFLWSPGIKGLCYHIQHKVQVFTLSERVWVSTSEWARLSERVWVSASEWAHLSEHIWVSTSEWARLSEHVRVSASEWAHLSEHAYNLGFDSDSRKTLLYSTAPSINRASKPPSKNWGKKGKKGGLELSDFSKSISLSPVSTKDEHSQRSISANNGEKKNTVHKNLISYTKWWDFSNIIAVILDEQEEGSGRMDSQCIPLSEDSYLIPQSLVLHAFQKQLTQNTRTHRDVAWWTGSFWEINGAASLLSLLRCYQMRLIPLCCLFNAQ